MHVKGAARTRAAERGLDLVSSDLPVDCNTFRKYVVYVRPPPEFPLSKLPDFCSPSQSPDTVRATEASPTQLANTAFIFI